MGKQQAPRDPRISMYAYLKKSSAKRIERIRAITKILKLHDIYVKCQKINMDTLTLAEQYDHMESLVKQESTIMRHIAAYNATTY
jgi:hypothetical protein